VVWRARNRFQNEAGQNRDDVVVRSKGIGLGLLALGLWSGGLAVSQLDALAGVNSGRVAQRPALPLRVVQAQLMVCDKALSVTATLVTPAPQLARKATDCLTLADRTLRTRPSFGLAHYIRALGLHVAVHPGAPDALAASARFSPSEGWLAERRLVAQIATPNLRREAEFDRDLGLLLNTQSGAELIARYYRYRPELRPVITKVANAATSKNQQRLLNLLRKAGRT